jgi:hypothetical protein
MASEARDCYLTADGCACGNRMRMERMTSAKWPARGNCQFEKDNERYMEVHDVGRRARAGKACFVHVLVLGQVHPWKMQS